MREMNHMMLCVNITNITSRNKKMDKIKMLYTHTNTNSLLFFLFFSCNLYVRFDSFSSFHRKCYYIDTSRMYAFKAFVSRRVLVCLSFVFSLSFTHSTITLCTVLFNSRRLFIIHGILIFIYSNSHN